MSVPVGSFLVTRCVCMKTSFDRLLPVAQAHGWTLADVLRETGCGDQCGMCRPYLAEMLRTGTTRFTAPVPPITDIFAPDA
jgi:bacterioferritin-associated ferredoxin